ncbi:MAG: putative ferredoxin-type protein [Candidatus Ozemobacter sibiricus]|jgi:polyferredoxin|uniref:Putative ferredoxin-type protein n=1 Tax=Candidatus Ozemobacter sibiricus TaxID=2268124 RepID=A0A367ZJU9_9BACT|nr:MAG: putative ferredoxin-type protein [Candidatus Ozemobacter sibiricus]
MIWLRRTVQGTCLLGFVLLFLRARFPFHPDPAPDLLLRASPLAPLFVGWVERAIPWNLWPGLLVLAMTPWLGRFFCGWFCPLGSLLDLVGRWLAPSSPERTGSQTPAWPRAKYLLLWAMVVAATGGLALWTWFDPLGLLNRGMAVVLYPIGTWLVLGLLGLLALVPGAEGLAAAGRAWIKRWIMPEPQALPAFLWPTLIFFLGVLTTEWVARRWWCRSLCPVGALLGLCARFRVWPRQVDQTCVQCRQCARRCPMGAIPPDDVTATSPLECTVCLECLDHCPVGIRAISFGPARPTGHPLPVAAGRRSFLQAAGLGLLAAAGHRLAHPDPEGRARLLRPPGARPEPAFLDRCIRCLACVRVCASNGACLHPTGLEFGPAALWTPRAIMKTGYCEYNCNLCGEVCPTGAIRRLPLPEKQKRPMGLAYFNKNLCIPYARFTDCLVCEEHCPLPAKAIQIHEREVELPGGGQTIVKFPYVVRERCIGCGICEHKCPLPGSPGVYVVAENEQRA